MSPSGRRLLPRGVARGLGGGMARRRPALTSRIIDVAISWWPSRPCRPSIYRPARSMRGWPVARHDLRRRAFFGRSVAIRGRYLVIGFCRSSDSGLSHG
ncbi:hypothetical protein FRACA_2520010 [Frankia canadensis]|uniref:Uncharacterized protein n=1 Tax=Frankia canadensis TaxID=1836972 RepID=A0A2I2KS63_9ACTN|nr:hypothetical protein FRACA_2520010 [Frankia canadensis]SOU55790.1 hypothetical protein FRACA_2520010 [Frankia canadensis]